MLAAIAGIDWALLGFIGAFALSYAGMRMLWAGCGLSGAARGVLLATPVFALSIVFTSIGQPGMAIAVCMASAVLMLTLGVGVAAAGRADFDYTMEATTPPTLRLIAPLAACACAIGFRGAIEGDHLVALAIISGLTLWSAAPFMKRSEARAWYRIAIATLLLAAAVALVILAGAAFQAAAGAMVVTPLIVLLAAPAILLPLMGLLSAEARDGHFAAAADTAAAFVIACIGVAMPAAIATGMLRNSAAARLPAKLAEHAIIMPIATWRIDSLLLLVTAVMLMPAANGRMRLGKIEGGFLIAVYLAYAAIASRAGVMQ